MINACFESKKMAACCTESRYTFCQSCGLKDDTRLDLWLSPQKNPAGHRRKTKDTFFSFSFVDIKTILPDLTKLSLKCLFTLELRVFFQLCQFKEMAKLVSRLVGSSTTLIQTEICRLFDGLPRHFGRGGDALGFILRGRWTSVQSSHWCDFIKHHYVFAKNSVSSLLSENPCNKNSFCVSILLK